MPEVAVTQTFQQRWDSAMLATYGTPKIEIVSGSGCLVVDSAGRTYLDLLAGIAVSALGHAHPAIAEAVAQQVRTLVHTSNLYAHPSALALAEKLLEISQSSGRVFFAQDGATANEAALKLARRHGYNVSPDGSKQVVVAAINSFHGRTMGALAVTGNPSKRDAFAPFPFDVRFVEFGDCDQLSAAMDQSVCAVILEPVQGEGGVNVAPPGYLAHARAEATKHNSVFIVDEVQSGIGRTGAWFASHAEGVRPDVITLAKGLGGGLPIGAMIVEPEFTAVLKPGDHGTTFGGNPISTSAALAVIQTIEQENLLEHVRVLADWLFSALAEVSHPALKGIRGRGLWLALVLAEDIAPQVERAALEAGFLVNAVRPNAIRLAPPLNITQSELESFVERIPQILDEATS